MAINMPPPGTRLHLSEREALREALETSTSMMEAMMVQLHSWGHEPTVNARGQMMKNRKLLSPNG